MRRTWISIVRAGLGTYVANFVAGEFTSTPTCVCSSAGSSSNTWCEQNGTTNSAQFTFSTMSSTGSTADTNFNIICMGQH